MQPLFLFFSLCAGLEGVLYALTRRGNSPTINRSPELFTRRAKEFIY